MDEDLVKVGLAGLAVIAFIGGFIGMSIKVTKELDTVVQAVTETMETKILNDLQEQNTLSLGEDYNIDISHINLETKNNTIGTANSALNVYGVINEEYAFKNTYDLNAEQFAALHKSGSDKQVISRLGEIFESLQLTKHDFTNIKAMSLGLENEEQLQQFAQKLGPAVETNSVFKADYNKTPDFFMPVYSRVNVSEKDGKTYAVLDVEGFEMHKKSSPNIGLGYLFGSMMYDATEDMTLSYVYGISMAYATAIKKADTYARVERFVVEVDAATANLSADELREYLVAGIMDNSIEYQKATTSYSDNLRLTTNKQYTGAFAK